MAGQPPTTPPDPHEGSEDDPPRREVDAGSDRAVTPPSRYEGGVVPAEDSGARRAPTVFDRLESASGPLALILFFLIGFGTGKWYVAWVVFLIPAVLHAWNRPSRKD